MLVESYIDVGLERLVIDRRLTSGYCTILEKLGKWSKKKNVIARSSAEAEFNAITQRTCELLWLENDDLEIKWKKLLEYTITQQLISLITFSNMIKQITWQ